MNPENDRPVAVTENPRTAAGINVCGKRTITALAKISLELVSDKAALTVQVRCKLVGAYTPRASRSSE